jgi:hypothetical protein
MPEYSTARPMVYSLTSPLSRYSIARTCSHMERRRQPVFSETADPETTEEFVDASHRRRFFHVIQFFEEIKCLPIDGSKTF